MYPKYVNIDGDKKPINTSYKVALRCFSILQDYTISDYERYMAVIYLLFGVLPDDNMLEKYVEKAAVYLQCGQTREEQNSKPADMDFEYDRGLINASFMQVYHIDLNNTDLHFWQFIELIEGLPEDCALSRVREVRTCDIKDYADKDKAKIRKLKQQYALPHRFTLEEQQASDEFERLLGGE